jgi:hypothetical protein
VGALLVWCSHPAVFVLAGAGAVLTWGHLRAGRWRSAGWAAAAAAVGGAGAVLHYLLFARSLTRNAYLLDYWKSAMMPVDSPWAAARWFLLALPHSLEGSFGAAGVWVAVPLFVAGCAGLWRGGRGATLGLLSMPGLLALGAAAVHQYPFDGRLLVFLVPLHAPVLAAGVDFLRRRSGGPRARWVAPLALAILLGEPAAAAVRGALAPPLKEDARPPLAYVAARRRPGDAVYVHFRARPAFEYYAPRLGLWGMPASLGERGDGRASVRAEVGRLRGRVWAVWVTTDPTADASVRAALAELGTPLAEGADGRNVRVRLVDMGDRSAAVSQPR